MTPRGSAPAEALTKLSASVRSLIEELLEPEGRERRRRAVQSLNGAKTDSSSSGIVASATKPAYRWGWLVATVVAVLKAADGPMQARDPSRRRGAGRQARVLVIGQELPRVRQRRQDASVRAPR